MKRRPSHYILNDRHEAIPVDVMTWMQRVESPAARRVALDTVETPTGKFDVSTVFLGLDHAFGSGPPVLFETMVFAPDSAAPSRDQYCERYHTWDEALIGHRRVVQALRDGTLETY